MEISPASNLNNTANIFSTQEAKFGDNPFLQLLIQQMRSQTPLDPVDNGSFMEQMSTFSSMEQQREMNENLLQLLQFQGALARLNGLTQGASMIGKEVEYITDGSGKRSKGFVESVSVDEIGDVLVRINGKDHPLAAIVSITGKEPPKSNEGSEGKGSEGKGSENEQK